MTAKELQFASRSFDDLLRNPHDLFSAAEFAAELEQVPPDPVDIVLVPPGYVERVYGWNRKGPRP